MPDVDDELRAAALGLDLAPVRWRRVRLRARMGWLVVGLVTVALAAVIAGLAILGKQAIDPTYSVDLLGVSGKASIEPQALPNPDAPARVLRRHYQRIATGDYSAAFALMSASFRAANPDWIARLRTADPYLKVVEVGPSRVSGHVAHVQVKFYARDRQASPRSDTQCRRFSGRARLLRQGGRWVYAPRPNQFDVQELSRGLAVCGTR